MKDTIQKILVCLFILNIAWIASADKAALKNPDGSWKWTNRLIHETSPYLLLHAHNPVDWYPWGNEAVELAKKENKLIFLIGRLFYMLLVPRDGAQSFLKPGNRRDDEQEFHQYQD